MNQIVTLASALITVYYEKRNSSLDVIEGLVILAIECGFCPFC